MADIEEGIRYTADIDDVKRKLDALERHHRDAESSTRSTMAGASGAWSDFGTRVSSVAGGVIGAAADIGRLVFTGLGAAGAAATVFGLKSAGAQEQTQIAFEGMLGSGERAQAFIKKLTDFAAATPFELPQLNDAARQLLGVGFAANDVVPILTKIGNTAASLGVGGEGVESVVRALGQMQGKGKASAEELNQISEAVPGFSAIKAVAEGLGVSTAQAFDMISKGAVPADQAIGLILAGMEKVPGAAGAMERQSKTLFGLWSTAKDTVSQGLGTAFSPIVELLSGAMPRAIEIASGALGRLAPAFESVISFGRAFLSAVPGDGFAATVGNLDDFVGANGRVVEIVGQVTSVLGDLWRIVQDGIIPVISAFATLLPDMITPLDLARGVIGFIADNATTLQPVLAGLLGGFLAFRVVSGVIGAISAAQAVLNAVMLMNPIGIVVIAIAALVAGLIYAWNNVDGFREFWTGVWESIKSMTGSAIEAITGFFGGFVDFVQSIPGRIVDFFNALPGLIGTAIGNASAMFINFGRDIGEQLLALPGVAWNALLDLGPTLWRAFNHGGRSMLAGVAAAIPALWDYLTGLPGAVIDIFGGAFTWLTHVGKNVIIGLWNGIVSMGQWIKDKVLDFFGGILGPISKALGLGSPSRITAQYGAWIVQGLMNGMFGEESNLARASERIGITALPDMGAAGGLGRTFAGATPGLVAGGGGGGGTAGATTVIVQGSVVTERELVAAIDQGLDEKRRREGTLRFMNA